MNRVAVFVDAGYLFAQGSALLSGQKRPRSETEIDLEKTLFALEEFACRISGLSLLRIYWYDGTATGPTPQHIAIAFQPRVKLRLGFVNTLGEQKGVDSLIVTDMILLARNRAMADAVLLSGDEDIRVGVQQAQEFGVRVHLLGITPCRGSQSIFLLQEADTTHEWTKAELATFLTYRPRPSMPAILPAKSPQPTASLPGPSTFVAVAELAIKQIRIDKATLPGVLASYDATHQLPPQLDKPLLGIAKTQLGLLGSKQREELREVFVQLLRALK